jgi:hypothetical protein
MKIDGGLLNHNKSIIGHHFQKSHAQKANIVERRKPRMLAVGKDRFRDDILDLEEKPHVHARSCIFYILLELFNVLMEIFNAADGRPHVYYFLDPASN